MYVIIKCLYLTIFVSKVTVKITIHASYSCTDVEMGICEL